MGEGRKRNFQLGWEFEFGWELNQVAVLKFGKTDISQSFDDSGNWMLQFVDEHFSLITAWKLGQRPARSPTNYHIWIMRSTSPPMAAFFTSTWCYSIAINRRVGVSWNLTYFTVKVSTWIRVCVASSSRAARHELDLLHQPAKTLENNTRQWPAVAMSDGSTDCMYVAQLVVNAATKFWTFGNASRNLLTGRNKMALLRNSGRFVTLWMQLLFPET